MWLCAASPGERHVVCCSKSGEASMAPVWMMKVIRKRCLQADRGSTAEAEERRRRICISQLGSPAAHWRRMVNAIVMMCTAKPTWARCGRAAGSGARFHVKPTESRFLSPFPGATLALSLARWMRGHLMFSALRRPGLRIRRGYLSQTSSLGTETEGRALGSHGRIEHVVLQCTGNEQVSRETTENHGEQLHGHVPRRANGVRGAWEENGSAGPALTVGSINASAMSGCVQRETEIVISDQVSIRPWEQTRDSCGRDT